VILSGSMVPELVFEAFSCGAYGYLPKLTSPDEVKLALDNVAKSNWYLSPVVTEVVLKKAIQLRELASGEDGKGTEVALTDRERELLKLLAEGNTFTEIARKLDINARSVERMKSKLEEKIQATNIVDLVRKAIKLGLINP
jgi:DNA-binding NarL/FixJ family response regulator